MMPVRSVTGPALPLAAALGGLVAAGAAVAEEPVGRPKTEAAAGMAPVAAPPIPTPADELPALEAPPGFTVETFASGILDARGLRDGKLYVPVGAPCNICEPDERYAKIEAGEHRV